MPISLAELEHAIDQRLADVKAAQAAAHDAAEAAEAIDAMTRDGVERAAEEVTERAVNEATQEAARRAAETATEHGVPPVAQDAAQQAMQEVAPRTPGMPSPPSSGPATASAPATTGALGSPTSAPNVPRATQPTTASPTSAAPDAVGPAASGGNHAPSQAAPQGAAPQGAAPHSAAAHSTPPAGGHHGGAAPRGATGGAAASGGSAPGADLGVATRWFEGLEQSVEHLTNPQPPPQPPSPAQQAVATARAVQGFVGSVMGALSVPGDMLNAGFANLTAPLAKVLPAFPAATMTMLYVGLPHTHNHPPSLIPPAPPVPLPSLGSVMLGTSVKVLINGMPAARCGDIGLAPTCCGFTPFFQIKTGSSNTFIGGNRAARMLDICQACTSADDRNSGTIAAGKIMGAIGAAARGIQKVQAAMGYAAIAMDAAEAAVNDDAAMGAAQGMAAAMAAAQMAADAAASALTKAMGKDPAGIPPRVIGAITAGHPNVLIGGFPMVNIPNPAEMLLKRLARYKRTPPPKRPPGHCGKPECD